MRTWISQDDTTCSTTAHRGDHPWNIWISRLAGFPGHSVEWRGLPFTSVTDCLNFLTTPVKTCSKITGTLVKTCGILAVVIISSPISSVCGLQHRHTATHSAEHTAVCTWINKNDTTFKCRNTYDCSWLKFAQDSFPRLYGSVWLTTPYSLKLQVVFRKRATNYSAKEPLITEFHRQYGFSWLTTHSILSWLTTGRPRILGCIIFIGHFPQKSPIISGSFAEKDLQLKASHGSWLTMHSLLCESFPKLQVVFRKRATNYRALLREMACKERVFPDSLRIRYFHRLYHSWSLNIALHITQHRTTHHSTSHYTSHHIALTYHSTSLWQVYRVNMGEYVLIHITQHRTHTSPDITSHSQVYRVNMGVRGLHIHSEYGFVFVSRTT